MKIIGLISSYLEGRLLEGAMRSLDRVGLDDFLVYEGPAGEPLNVNNSDLASTFARDVVHVSKCGRWRTDARKRNEMVQEAKHRAASIREPLWGVWLDGDEILVNGEYLRDQLQAVTWADEDGETIHWPIRLIEADGSISIVVNRLVRLDLVQSVDISASVITNVHGVEEAWGNKQEDARIWLEMWMGGIDRGKMVAWPPLPCEPHIFHRSHLRHPERRGLRLHKQEDSELRKAGKIP